MGQETPKRLMDAACRGDEEAVLAALSAGDRPIDDDGAVLDWAAGAGMERAVRRLMKLSDPKIRNSAALALAAESGHAGCVELLIPVSDPKAGGSVALQLAALEGHGECVRLLIPVSDPREENSLALSWAVEKGHAECVALLLPASDPLARDEQGRSIAEQARWRGFEGVAAMVEAFVEAGELAQAVDAPKKGSPKATL